MPEHRVPPFLENGASKAPHQLSSTVLLVLSCGYEWGGAE